jgi:NTP pyrophosphatase (non-canonical NTP hydrolase)
MDEEDRDFLHAALGVATESGEVVDIIKKHLYYGKEIDMVHLKEELGDLLWYITLCLDTLGSTLEEAIETNMEKLEKRYPNSKWSKERALNRRKR